MVICDSLDVFYVGTQDALLWVVFWENETYTSTSPPQNKTLYFFFYPFG